MKNITHITNIQQRVIFQLVLAISEIEELNDLSESSNIKRLIQEKIGELTEDEIIKEFMLRMHALRVRHSN
jgi:hypothetical protein